MSKKPNKKKTSKGFDAKNIERTEAGRDSQGKKIATEKERRERRKTSEEESGSTTSHSKRPFKVYETKSGKRVLKTSKKALVLTTLGIIAVISCAIALITSFVSNMGEDNITVEEAPVSIVGMPEPGMEILDDLGMFERFAETDGVPMHKLFDGMISFEESEILSNRNQTPDENGMFGKSPRQDSSE